MCLPSTSTTRQPAASSRTTTSPSWLPLDALSKSSYTYARSNLHPLILAHSCRVYLYALSLAQHESSDWAGSSRLPLLLTTALFHDMGTSAKHDEPVRFEVAGADAAVAHLESFNVSREDSQSVWTAIALHTSPQIAERIDPLARLIRLAVLVDFKSPDAMSLLDLEEIASVEEDLPRGQIEKVLGDTVVEQAIRQPVKAPAATWVGNMKKSYLDGPEWKGWEARGRSARKAVHSTSTLAKYNSHRQHFSLTASSSSTEYLSPIGHDFLSLVSVSHKEKVEHYAYLTLQVLAYAFISIASPQLPDPITPARSPLRQLDSLDLTKGRGCAEGRLSELEDYLP